MSKDVCQALASPTALRGSDPVSEPGIKALKEHLIKWPNAANWSREKSVLRLMIPEAPSMLLDLVVGRRVRRAVKCFLLFILRGQGGRLGLWATN